MNICRSTRHWGIALLLFFLTGTVFGCGSVSDEATGIDGSAVSTVGGTTVVGGDRTINLTTNRNSIAVGDTALVTLTLSCSTATSLNCIQNSGGELVFAALPTEFQTGDGAPQQATEINVNYSITPAATLSATSSVFTLAAGTRADSTASPATSVIPGNTATEIVFSITLTGARTGTAILTAQALDTIATLLLKVF